MGGPVPTPPTLVVGTQFDSMHDLRSACKHYALYENFEFRTIALDDYQK